MDPFKGTKSFDGTGDIQAFIAKVDIISSLKGYTDEKRVQALASKLEGNAFDVYLRMSAEDRNNFDTIKAELLSEHEVGQVDRERAAAELSSRSRRQNEPIKTCVYKIDELVKLAYPGFTADARGVIAKDAFVRGLHPDMQLHLKTLEKVSTANLKSLVDETNRLEVAGITSSKTDRSTLQVSQSDEDVGGSSSENAMGTFTNDVIKRMDEHAVNFVRSGRTGTSGNFRKSNFRGSYANRDNRRPDDYDSEQKEMLEL